MPNDSPNVALTIAGSDSGGGAGIQADLLTFAAFGVFGTTAITAVTAQNTVRVQRISRVPLSVVDEQIRSVVGDFSVKATKTGMLGGSDIVDLVVDLARQNLLPLLVVDPVLVATSGAPLFEHSSRSAYRRLLPFADVVTPNIPEAEHLLNREITTLTDMIDSARALYDLGAQSVVIKGGHRDGHEATDVFFDGEHVEVLKGERVDSANVHGTGCTLSAAVCALRTRGLSQGEAVTKAKEYVNSCIRIGRNWSLGSGPGPIGHKTSS